MSTPYSARTVLLRNGTEAPNVLARYTLMYLESFIEQEPAVLNDFIRSVFDSSHQLSADSGVRLLELELIQTINPDGTAIIDDATRNIVLASVEGTEADMTFVTPYAPKPN